MLPPADAACRHASGVGRCWPSGVLLSGNFAEFSGCGAQYAKSTGGLAVRWRNFGEVRDDRFLAELKALKSLALPRGLHQLSQINGLQKSGTPNCSRELLGFLRQVSHQKNTSPFVLYPPIGTQSANVRFVPLADIQAAVGYALLARLGRCSSSRASP